MTFSGEELTQIVVRRLRETFGRIPIGVIADFCGVDAKTVGGWFVDGKPLGGLPTIKLWHLLAAAGIPSPELEETRRRYPLGEYIGRLLAFDVFSMQDACKFAGTVDGGSILRAIRMENRLSNPGRRGEDSEDREDYDPEKELRNEYDELLEMAVDELLGKLPAINEEATLPETDDEEKEVTPKPVIQQVVVPAPTPETAEAIRLQLVMNAGRELAGALAVARMAMTQFTPLERETLRSLLGENGMFELSHALQGLCSERAYTMQNGGH